MILQEGKPLFTSDWTGIWHALLTFGTVIGVLGAIIVKWGQSADSKRLEQAEKSRDQIAHDLNELGIKVDKIDKSCIERTTQQDELRSRLDRNEIVMQGMLTTDGELKAKLDTLTLQNVGLQRDMTTLINESGARIMENVTGLRVEIAELRAAKQERDAIAPLMERFVQSLNDSAQRRGPGGK